MMILLTSSFVPQDIEGFRRQQKLESVFWYFDHDMWAKWGWLFNPLRNAMIPIKVLTVVGDASFSWMERFIMTH